jgi:hypothetical protein
VLAGLREAHHSASMARSWRRLGGWHPWGPGNLPSLGREKWPRICQAMDGANDRWLTTPSSSTLAQFFRCRLVALQRRPTGDRRRIRRKRDTNDQPRRQDDFCGRSRDAVQTELVGVQLVGPAGCCCLARRSCCTTAARFTRLCWACRGVCCITGGLVPACGWPGGGWPMPGETGGPGGGGAA